MKNHKKAMVAPIVITILVVLYYCAYFGVLLHVLKNPVLRVLLGFIPLVFSVVMIGVCIQRIREIKSGEEDDLDRY